MRKNSLKPYLFDNSIPEPNSGCWLWERAVQSDGYGNVLVKKKNILAHRMAYELAFSCKIPDDIEVCHTCDTPQCINPDHLFLGSHSDNMKDRSHKGRWSNGNRKGSEHPLAKLSEESVVFIRKDKRPHRIIATEYGVTVGTVGAIKGRRTWSHVP